MKIYLILIIVLIYSLAVSMAETNKGIEGHGEEKVDMADIESPVLGYFRVRRRCLPLSCIGNCGSGKCPYWCNLCYGK
uniref:Candidate secreted effector n=1 Tax=Meloidogyne incognita TaxID=6306 RepID=A0A914MG55_MELIC